jgi:hypothetical protein
MEYWSDGVMDCWSAGRPNAPPLHYSITPCPTPRFTLDGDEALESEIARLCVAALHGVERIVSPYRLEALWLAGGYGRGEGGVLRLPGGDRPYNDLEFYVCLRGNEFLNRRRFGSRLRMLADRISRAAGLDVEFQIISFARLQHSPPSMFYYDLVAGHRQLYGAEHFLERCPRHADPGCLSIAEGTRLLMNRGTGLVLAWQRLARNPLEAEDADFIGRNIAKARLALGDAVLTALGQFHWSCLERNRRLLALKSEEVPLPLEELRQHHSAGVAFKLHPKLSAPRAESLRREYERVVAFMLPVWLWIESRRLRTEFRSVRDYVTTAVDRWPERNAWRNRLLNAWIHGPVAFLSPRGGQHPRGRVLAALAMLLWDREDLEARLPSILKDGLAKGPTTESRIGNPCYSVASSFDPVGRFRRIWERVR